MFDHLTAAFIHQVNSQPGEVAVVVQLDQQVISLTWADLAQQVFRRSDELNRLFADRTNEPRIVGYASKNSLGDLVTALACPFAGAIEAPFDQQNPNAKKMFDEKLAGQWIADTDCDLTVTTSLHTIPSVSVDVESPTLILWTSGTTSDPKGVTLTHQNLCNNAMAKLTAVPQRTDDVRLTALPICHAYARTSDLGTWLLSGCTLALGLGFAAWKTLGPVVRPTLANTAPSLAARIMTSDADAVGASRLRLLGCGGAAMSDDQFDAWKLRSVTVIQGYGLTETSPVICSATPDNATAGLVGDFVDGWEHEIRDGQLFVRGPHVMQGYWNDPIETAKRIDEEGWLDTRDLVQRDAATGQIRVLGRIDDVIVLENGRKVHPQSIEKQIVQIDGVRHAMLVTDGRRLVVWLDAEPIDDIQAKLDEQLNDRPAWQCPATVHYFSRPLSQQRGELTSKGTIRREVLRKHICS